MSSVEQLGNALARSHLVEADTVRELRKLWVLEAGGNAADVERFRAWLTANAGVTEYQLGSIERGHADQLYLGPYTIQERIGKGRMAGVYSAKHKTGQLVALKVLPPSKARDPDILARFQREARLALRLKHPNIVRTFQAGEIKGLHFLAMEHLDGEPFDELLARRGALPPAEAVRLVHQVLLGLEELHEKGLIHRDIKPANLMVIGGTPSSTEQATIKLLDIGTGRALFDDPSNDLTNEGDLLGTPLYMSPEQARNPHGADIRADIYSAGCVLYHTLSGQPPFQDTNPVRLLVRHATETPVPVRKLNPAVPDGLQQILDWMLAKDPAQRYPTPSRAAGALQVFLAAGAAPARIELDPEMRAYLGSLASEEKEDSINVELVAMAQPVAGPIAQGGAIPIAAPVILPARPRPRPPAAPAPVVPAVPVARAAPVVPAVPVARPTRPAPPPPTPARIPRPPTDEDEDEEETPSRLSGRDFLMLLIGVAALAVVGSLSMAIYAIVRANRRPPDDSPEPDPDDR